jgi:hypothetical protein
MRRPLAVNSNMKSRLQKAAQLEAAGKPTQRLELWCDEFLNNDFGCFRRDGALPHQRGPA